MEGFRIALLQIRAHKMRSLLTALGVIIGIIAVTLMGTAICGNRDRVRAQPGGASATTCSTSRSGRGTGVDDWWNYRNRPRMEVAYAEQLNRIIADTPNSQLMIAVPDADTVRSVKFGGRHGWTACSPRARPRSTSRDLNNGDSTRAAS